MSTIDRPCDLCFVRGGIYTESDHVDIAIRINGERGKLDLCDPHYEQLILPVLEAVADRKDDDLDVRRKTARKIGPFRCQILGCPTPVLKHKDSFWQHLRKVHGTTLDVYREEYGEPEPLTPEEAAQVVVEQTCPAPDCGKVYSTEKGNRWPLGALNSHLRGRHGLKPDGVTPVR